jgi:hypothetical protein
MVILLIARRGWEQMDASELKTLLRRLSADGASFKIPEKLTALVEAFQNLMGSPTEPTYQIAVSEALAGLKKAFVAMESWYDPTLTKQIDQIGASPYFSSRFYREIDESIAQNTMTPAVTQQLISERADQYTKYVALITRVHLGMGQLEIGFRIPREIFSNELDGLVDELRAVRRIIRAFSEATTGAAEPIEVHRISSTDPIFFFGLAVTTIIAIGNVVTWSLNTWGKLEEIRKVRIDAKKLPVFSEKEIDDLFSSKIDQAVDEAIDQKVAELLGNRVTEVGRAQEQKTDLTWACKALVARIERGMTVEIKFLPPEPLTKENEENETLKPFRQLDAIRDKLAFPEPDKTPVIALPKAS